MDIKEFVSETLLGIFNGVADTQKQIEEKGGAVNPCITVRSDVPVSGLFTGSVGNGTFKKICIAEFDVVLSVSDKEKTGGKIGVLLGSIGAGAARESGAETANTTRVKFSVPYSLP